VNDHELITNALRERQNLSADAAENVVKELERGGEDLVQAASEWARTGELPAEPVLHGHSPATLGRSFPPSVALTAMTALRHEPEVARQALRHRGLPRRR
jgi:hypothetical protein